MSNFCKDCEHFRAWPPMARIPPPPDFPLCKAPDADPPRDMIYGHLQLPSARSMRGAEHCCGRDGRWFQAKAQQPQRNTFFTWLTKG